MTSKPGLHYTQEGQDGISDQPSPPHATAGSAKDLGHLTGVPKAWSRLALSALSSLCICEVACHFLASLGTRRVLWQLPSTFTDSWGCQVPCLLLPQSGP